MLKKIASITTALVLVISVTGCSQITEGGSTGLSQIMPTSQKVAGSEGTGTGVSQMMPSSAQQVAGYALGFALGSALAKSITD